MTSLIRNYFQRCFVYFTDHHIFHLIIQYLGLLLLLYILRTPYYTAYAIYLVQNTLPLIVNTLPLIVNIFCLAGNKIFLIVNNFLAFDPYLLGTQIVNIVIIFVYHPQKLFTVGVMKIYAGIVVFYLILKVIFLSLQKLKDLGFSGVKSLIVRIILKFFFKLKNYLELIIINQYRFKLVVFYLWILWNLFFMLYYLYSSNIFIDNSLLDIIYTNNSLYGDNDISYLAGKNPRPNYIEIPERQPLTIDNILNKNYRQINGLLLEKAKWIDTMSLNANNIPTFYPPEASSSIIKETLPLINALLDIAKDNVNNLEIEWDIIKRESIQRELPFYICKDDELTKVLNPYDNKRILEEELPFYGETDLS